MLYSSSYDCSDNPALQEVRACWRGWSTGPIFDCRETAVGLCPWPRTVCESVGERWSDEAGCLLTSGIRSYRVGYPVIPRLARMLTRLVDGTDFRLSRSGGENRTGGYPT
jgi:hypothetical protein